MSERTLHFTKEIEKVLDTTIELKSCYPKLTPESHLVLPVTTRGRKAQQLEERLFLLFALKDLRHSSLEDH